MIFCCRCFSKPSFRSEKEFGGYSDLNNKYVSDGGGLCENGRPPAVFINAASSMTRT
jgi:hypothetical protein